MGANDYEWCIFTDNGDYVDSCVSLDEAKRAKEGYEDSQYNWLIQKAFGPTKELVIKFMPKKSVLQAPKVLDKKYFRGELCEGTDGAFGYYYFEEDGTCSGLYYNLNAGELEYYGGEQREYYPDP